MWSRACSAAGSFTLAFKSFNPPASGRSWGQPLCAGTAPRQAWCTTPPTATCRPRLGERFLADAAHLEQTNPTAFRHEYLGEAVGCGTAVFGNIQLQTLTTEQCQSFDRVYHGVDWGWYPDPWAYNAVHYDAARRTLVIFDELTRRRTPNRETARLLLDRGLDRTALLTADAAEPKSCADYRAAGLPCRAAVKGSRSVAAGMKWLQSLNAIIIDPVRCPETAAEFTGYEYLRDARTGEVTNAWPDADNHHIDAVRYALESVWRRRGS